MTALYNEIDPFAADWLEELIHRGLICPGRVDRRDIRDLRPNDLDGYDQFHAFAGIGGWSYALRLAGISDSRRVWTASCPCQPFSAAGRALGFVDERHLWPAFFHLVKRCRPPRLYGEQVASALGLEWLDLVFADLEGALYAPWAADICAAGLGAPHIRQRMWFVADSYGNGQPPASWREFHNAEHHIEPRGELGDASSKGLSPRECGELSGPHRDDQGRAIEQPGRAPRAVGVMGDADSFGETPVGSLPGRPQSVSERSPWASAEWIACRDGKHRPTEPGLSPLAHGVPGRVGQLRGYGNAIVPPVAAAFIKVAESVLAGRDA